MKILIVDDVAFIRMSFRKIFESKGYKIVGEATDGVQAVELYFSLTPDLVVMDIHMPVLDGIGALQSIKSKDPLAKIIMVSAYSDVANVKVSIQNGASDFIVKPVEQTRLLAAAEKLLRG
jgi:two-component system chemotaxis response regulator CheY